jgi:hypothetical protein
VVRERSPRRFSLNQVGKAPKIVEEARQAVENATALTEIGRAAVSDRFNRVHRGSRCFRSRTLAKTACLGGNVEGGFEFA